MAPSQAVPVPGRSTVRDVSCRQLVLKVASRCNLNCDYCYVYNVGDTTWRTQPRVMSQAVVSALIQRVRSHCARHGRDRFTFIFHGGEPLLAGQAFYQAFVHLARAQLLPDVTPIFTLQTNGTLLTEEWCALFGALGISIGISLDGPEDANDRHRVDHRGRGSYQRVRRGINTALSSPLGPSVGLLTVIDVTSDPLAIYQHHKSLGVTMMDFLLPDCTHDHPARGLVPGSEATPYADWLIAIFDRWFHESPVTTHIRIFEETISLILGASDSIDTMGPGANQVLVIEADGSIEPVGSLKVCGDGFTKIGANVLADEIDAALESDLAELYYFSGSRLAPTCQACPIQHVCGGGYLPMRFSRERGFDNESVYCLDLMKLITHIQCAVVNELSESQQLRLGIAPLSFAKARQQRDQSLVGA